MKSKDIFLPFNYIFEKMYSAHERIGYGAFGTVFRGENLETKKPIALKVEDSDQEIISIEREGKIMKAIQGIKGIPKLY